MTPVGEDPDVRGNYYFMLTLGGAEVAGYFRECSGFSSEHDVVEQRSADAKGQPQVYKMPGQMKWSNITLKRGVDNKAELWQWRKLVIDGKVTEARKDGTIQLIDFAGSPVVTFKFVKAWPCKYTAPGVNASSNEVLVEEIEIAHEGWERV
ncbi:MAG TPA: phage tail protein [Baekduia sp.]|nr:phage tail protein [Baekduia sp.]